MEFKDRIKSLRLSMNATMDDIANAVGVSKSTVQRWESGDIKNLRRDKIAKLAYALHTSPAYLMGWADDPAVDGDGMEVDAGVMAISAQKKPTVKDDGLSDVERLFLSLPPERREEVLHFMEYLSSQSEK